MQLPVSPAGLVELAVATVLLHGIGYAIAATTRQWYRIACRVAT